MKRTLYMSQDTGVQDPPLEAPPQAPPSGDPPPEGGSDPDKKD